MHLLFPIKHSSLFSIGHLKIKKHFVFGIFNHYSFCNEVILGVSILNICQAKFSKFIFNVVLSYKVPYVLLQNFYIYLKRLSSYCI